MKTEIINVAKLFSEYFSHKIKAHALPISGCRFKAHIEQLTYPTLTYGELYIDMFTDDYFEFKDISTIFNSSELRCTKFSYQEVKIHRGTAEAYVAIFAIDDLPKILKVERLLDPAVYIIEDSMSNVIYPWNN